MVTQAQLASIARLKTLVNETQAQIDNESERVLDAVEAGASVEPGKYTITIRRRWRRPKVGEIDASSDAPAKLCSAPLTQPTQVTQAQLAHIEDLKDLVRRLQARLDEEQRKLLEALEANAPVEPGKRTARIKTRWRRRRVHPPAGGNAA